MSDGPLVAQSPLGSQGLVCGRVGLGAMGFACFYGSPTEQSAVTAVLKRAVELGVNMIDTAELYGGVMVGLEPGVHSERMIGLALQNGLAREKVILATKHMPPFEKFAEMTGADGKIPLALVRASITQSVEGSLERLFGGGGGILDQADGGCIDLYYLHRAWPADAAEDAMRVLAELVAAKKIRYVGVSEHSPDLIRKMHAIHPISAVQQEWSLIVRDLEEDGIVAVCRELGIGIVPYSPIARGFLAGVFNENGPEGFRASIPYMDGEKRGENVVILKEKIADAWVEKTGLSPAQLALAWVLQRGDDVFPIPGTTKLAHLEENAAAYAKRGAVTREIAAELESAAAGIKGERGPGWYMGGTYTAQAGEYKSKAKDVNKN